MQLSRFGGRERSGQCDRVRLDCGVGEHEDADHVPTECGPRLMTTTQELMSRPVSSDLDLGASVSDLVRSAQGHIPNATAIDKGTATRLRRAALVIEGVAPADRAARSHKNQANEPVTKRFGPMFNPTRRA